MKKRLMTYFTMMCIVFVLTACGKGPVKPEMQQQKDAEDIMETSTEGSKKIEVPLKDKDGVEIGVATLDESPEGVQVDVQVSHMEPGSYGIHMHEAGKCEAPDFESAGGHFNPDNRSHGFYQSDGPHKGDMENLQVNEDGEASQTYLNAFVSLKKGVKNSLVTEDGTSIIIHEHADDYSSQPAGDAGERIYCGVISAPDA